MCEQYNGWTNRETWAVKLWIDNEQRFYYHAQSMAECLNRNDQRTLADGLEEWITEMLDFEELLSSPPAQRKVLVSMSSDIGSLYRVNWWEIAESYLSEMQLQEAN